MVYSGRWPGVTQTARQYEGSQTKGFSASFVVLLPLFLGFVLLKQEAAQEYQADNARPGGQDQQPAPVKAAALRGRLWDSGYGLLLLCQAENGGIEHGPAGSLGHFSGVVRRDGVAGGVFAGSGAGIGGGGVVEAPASCH